MNNKITQEDVRYIANLSRIHLKNEEVDPLTRNLEDILGYITKLNNLDTTKIEPTSHVCAMDNVYRKDETVPSFSQENALRIAVDQTKGAFKVPKIIE